ncbi:MAG: transcriptional regulator NanR [Mesorhizobium sp.]|uniref:transcriptional regulator NanR n=3 Tax=unclassified Mesorhizobium TaxID=325217 RepID=UPI000FD1D794|nr:transcriptional regulator NanR [Mesorhizobium sp.]RUW97347.1 transcriptional regulator NanR [Mesorhizobium sp. M8A.F.Ca.ET.059.01.1.1]RVD49788.1 transcriptional regulator NanR [Mesorhizobium sp. M8A.F.Ca.ET.023.02.2.1]TGQ77726.1 transcriptional regulator NanR [Mesorhizobium sp. M8A.F.Ca.ET.207.01.1.1]RWC73054.1 MAG: transcriptional regulator NanR [Mesorhizobium sp.]TIT35236.1 MAG: transcriptional regulator NanR [Mesorhizobium sp.]
MHNMPVRKKLSDEVRLRLEAMIRDEIYPVGASLPSERELMSMFDVGRPSVREALFALEKMGLVRINSGERPKVTRPTPKNMLEQLTGTAHLLMDQPDGIGHFEQLRLFLEVSIARHAAEVATRSQIDALAAALAENERAISRARAFALTDVAFHRVLTAIPGNPIFLAAHEALVEWLINQRIHMANTELENRISFAGHKNVFEAIERHDPEAAGQAMREHLENARRKFNPGQSKPD